MLISDILSYWKLRARQNKPVHLILFITDNCNSKCSTCFYGQNLNKGEKLSPEDIEKISEAMGELIWLDVSGGEPFLRQDIDQICYRFINRNHVRFLNIPTNAIQTNVISRSVEAILANPGDFRLNIAISLDGIGENHDRIRGVPGNYDRALKTMEAMREIRATDQRLTVSVVTTLMRSNVEDVKRLLNMWVAEWDLDYHSVNILRGQPVDPRISPPTPEQYAQVSKLQAELSGHQFNRRWLSVGGRIATTGRVMLNRYYMREIQGIPKNILCNAGDVSCVIDANADVSFCELLKTGSRACTN